MRESVHRKLERVRTPRVHITYDQDIGSAVQMRELPFVIGVLGNFSGSSPHRVPWKNRRFAEIEWDSFDAVLAALQPRVHFSIPASIAGGEIEIDLGFATIEDFEPARVAQQIGPLQVLQESTAPDDRARLQRYLDRVLHAPEFQELEAAWRGLWYLIARVETSAELKVQMIDVTKKELLRDLERAPEFDQSFLFRKVYEERYGSQPPEPFGLFIGNYYFGPGPQDVSLLERLAQVASTCLAPFIAAVGPDMFGFESFAQLEQARDLSRIFDSTAYAKWKAFRESEDARFVGLVLPRMLVRSPYGLRPGTDADFQYDEDTRGSRYLLWGNSAFALGASVANAFARYGWCGAFRGVESGGMVEGLPTWEQPVEGGGKIRSTMEVMVSDRREKELADRGFIALVQFKGTDMAAFFSVPSCARHRLYDSDAATANSRLSCLLQYVLTASRFMHYVKAIASDRRGLDETRGELERYLNNWITSYVLSDDQASPAIKARHPLREARIDVAELPDRPGAYRAIAFLRPHFQLDELNFSIRLVTGLT